MKINSLKYEQAGWAGEKWWCDRGGGGGVTWHSTARTLGAPAPGRFALLGAMGGLANHHSAKPLLLLPPSPDGHPPPPCDPPAPFS